MRNKKLKIVKDDFTFGNGRFPMGDNTMIDNGNGTVTDIKTGLMWQQATAPGGGYTWAEAMEYCKNISLGGHSDWRLPTIKELVSIVDFGRFEPSINTDYFPDTKASYYWSSTTNANYTDYARHMHFHNGYDHNHPKSGYSYVRAVRGGQSGSLGDSVISTTNPLYAEIDRLRTETSDLHARIAELEKGHPLFQSDPEKLYYWTGDLYKTIGDLSDILDRFPEFDPPYKYEFHEAIVDCREGLQKITEGLKPIKAAFDESSDDCKVCSDFKECHKEVLKKSIM